MDDRAKEICKAFDLSIHTDADELTHRFADDETARRFLECLVWPDGPFCPHCGSVSVRAFKAPVRSIRKGIKGKDRRGLFQCAEQSCRGQFSVTTNTPMHATKLPLVKWIKAMFYLLSSSKGISSVVLARHLGVTQPTAWKMAHAIREMMDDRKGEEAPLTGEVEVDTKRLGGAPRKSKVRKYVWNKRGKGSERPIVLIMAGRDGRVRTKVVAGESKAVLEPPMKQAIDSSATLLSDADRALAAIGKDFADHRSVVHSKDEFVRNDGDVVVHVNRAEGFASMLERSKFGVYHRFSRHHMQRYLDEMAWLYEAGYVRAVETSADHVQKVIDTEPFVEQLIRLLGRAKGRQVRWSAKGGLYWPPPTAPGDPSAPSREEMLVRSFLEPEQAVPRKDRPGPKFRRKRPEEDAGTLRLRSTSRVLV